MPRLPMMEIDAEASDVLAAHVAPCVHQLKQFFGFVAIKKLRIQKLCHPIHLMSVGEIEGDLDILVGVLDHDHAVIVKLCALPFAFEEDCATRLYFCRSELGRLKKGNRIGEGERRRWRISRSVGWGSRGSEAGA